MGHPQPETSMQVYNWNYDDIINRKIQKFSKAMDTRFHSVIDRFKKNLLMCFGILEWETLGIILPTINCLHITKVLYQSIYNVLTKYRILQGCVILDTTQTVLKVNLGLQEAIIVQNPNTKYVPSTYQVKSGYKPIPEWDTPIQRTTKLNHDVWNY